LYAVQEKNDLKQLLSSLLPFMWSKSDWQKLIQEFKKINGSSTSVVRKIIMDQLLPQMAKYVYFGFENTEQFNWRDE